MHDLPREITHGDEHIVEHQYVNRNDEFTTLIRNDIEVPENDNDDDTTMVDGHMV